MDDEQVLVCPECQDRTPEWADRATPCPVCGSKKLSKTLGDLVCRSCTHQWSLEPFTLD